MQELLWSERPLSDPDGNPVAYTDPTQRVNTDLALYSSIYPGLTSYWWRPQVFIQQIAFQGGAQFRIYQFQLPYIDPPGDEMNFWGVVNFFTLEGNGFSYSGTGASFKLLFYYKPYGAAAWTYFGGYRSGIYSAPRLYCSTAFPSWPAEVFRDGDALGIAMQIIFSWSGHIYAPPNGIMMDVW